MFVEHCFRITTWSCSFQDIVTALEVRKVSQLTIVSRRCLVEFSRFRLVSMQPQAATPQFSLVALVLFPHKT